MENNSNKYRELKKQTPINNECFFAFSKAQFDEGIAKNNLQDKTLIDAGSGLYATQKGLDDLMKAIDDNRAKIIAECPPQEVYEYEFWNHECEYVGSDREAIKIVIDYFGEEKAKTVVRKYAHYKF